MDANVLPYPKVPDIQGSALGLEADIAFAGLAAGLVHQHTIEVGLDNSVPALKYHCIPLSHRILRAFLHHPWLPIERTFNPFDGYSSHQNAHILRRHLKLNPGGPNLVFSLKEVENAAIYGNAAGPAPLQVQRVIGKALFRTDVTERMATDVENAVIDSKGGNAGLLSLSKYYLPPAEVLPIEQLPLGILMAA